MEKLVGEHGGMGSHVHKRKGRKKDGGGDSLLI